ncbi:MAG: S8 family serine peptidase [Acidobacteria bacterium]|nr:S8 family serine peptidase [Acidobacteriota bacterium]
MKTEPTHVVQFARIKANRNRIFFLFITFICFAVPAMADRFIVRTSGGPVPIHTNCSANGNCIRVSTLGDPGSQFFLLTTGALSNAPAFVSSLLNTLGVVAVEPDQIGNVMGATASGGVPPALYDNTPVDYFGNTVWRGYATQPATQIVNLPNTQSTWNLTGSGVVAVIDTGVDSTHPALQGALVSGYDFIRNEGGIPDEKSTVSLPNPPIVQGVPPAYVNDSTAAVVDDSTSAVVDDSTSAVVDDSTSAVVDSPKYSAFGHGTMVAGVIRLVSPSTKIMPLRTFNANGTGYLSDVVRAVIFAIGNGAKILNMSFSFPSSSAALQTVLNLANSTGIIAVASGGNNGQNVAVYPAAYSTVMGVASTTNSDALSLFSNYGTGVHVGAPGEGIVTFYPFGTYAAGWGTSYSAPLVSGTAALLLSIQNASGTQAAAAIAHAQAISASVGNGRLDVYQAVLAWRAALGM